MRQNVKMVSLIHQLKQQISTFIDQNRVGILVETFTTIPLAKHKLSRLTFELVKAFAFSLESKTTAMSAVAANPKPRCDFIILLIRSRIQRFSDLQATVGVLIQVLTSFKQSFVCEALLCGP